tara:strand:- start:73689 stop:74066 length:378 start_codon:yes stop_codon:yes gene_type:complete
MRKLVFPTPVGVFPRYETFAWDSIRLPHARGGVSGWGDLFRSYSDVFPTPVGVFPSPPMPKQQRPRLPHARGGVSQVNHSAGGGLLSSPRPWGCFPGVIAAGEVDMVFPTPVGVFLHRRRQNHTG